MKFGRIFSARREKVRRPEPATFRKHFNVIKVTLIRAAREREGFRSRVITSELLHFQLCSASNLTRISSYRTAKDYVIVILSRMKMLNFLRTFLSTTTFDIEIQRKIVFAVSMIISKINLRCSSTVESQFCRVILVTARVCTPKMIIVAQTLS